MLIAISTRRQTHSAQMMSSARAFNTGYEMLIQTDASGEHGTTFTTVDPTMAHAFNSQYVMHFGLPVPNVGRIIGKMERKLSGRRLQRRLIIMDFHRVHVVQFFAPLE